MKLPELNGARNPLIALTLTAMLGLVSYLAKSDRQRIADDTKEAQTIAMTAKAQATQNDKEIALLKLHYETVELELKKLSIGQTEILKELRRDNHHAVPSVNTP